MDDTSSQAPDWPEPSTGPDPDAARLTAAIPRLNEADGPADEAGGWPESLWRIVVELGAPRWSLPTEFGGAACDRPTLARRYARVAEGSLTAAFILTQHDAAVRRMVPAAIAGRGRAAEWLARIADGKAFTTVGISQLTTSRRHGQAALVATETADGYRLDGVIPWVTAAPSASVLVTGAVLADGRQLLIALPTDRPGLNVRPAFPLAALQASCTCEIACEGVPVTPEDLLAGPTLDVLATSDGGSTGGLETSALALGQTRAALVALSDQAGRRDELIEPFDALADSWRLLANDLLAAAEGRTGAPPSARIRGSANTLVLRATQAYLTARKGSGFLRTDPAQRWARQALFFLVWSCPAPVAHASIRDLAGLCSA